VQISSVGHKLLYEIYPWTMFFENIFFGWFFSTGLATSFCNGSHAIPLQRDSAVNPKVIALNQL
jgi:hypothetical protein